MPIVDGAYKNPGWINGTTPAIDDTEMNAISDSLECLPIANGGTGATTIAGARNALGLGNTSGAIPIANGGTGATTVAGARNALGLGNTSGAVPVANGGTGATTAAQARTNLGITAENLGFVPTTGGTFTGDVTIRDVFYATNTGVEISNVTTELLSAAAFGDTTVVPVANGGTGATTPAQARANLGACALTVYSQQPQQNVFRLSGSNWGTLYLRGEGLNKQLLNVWIEGNSNGLYIVGVEAIPDATDHFLLLFNRTVETTETPTLRIVCAA